MKDKTTVFITLVVGILAWAEFGGIVTTISPSQASVSVLWIFFICLFTGLSSLMSLVWHPLRRSIHRNASLSRLASIRQAALLSLVITLCLFFKSLNILSAWDVLPLAISALLIEFFFQADKSLNRYESA